MKIIYEDFEGLHVVIPSPDWAGTLEELAKSVAPEDCQIVEDDIIPADRTFRNAWKAGGGGIAVDLDKAKQIWADKLRLERKPLFEKNDIALMDAVTSGDTAAKQAAIEMRDALRDLPEHPDIENAATPDELKALTIDVLLDGK